MLKIILFSLLALAGREQGIHVHGSGHLTVAFDGTQGKIQIEAPGEALFGFEHAPTSKADKQKSDEALKKLENRIAEMIVFEKSLGCAIKNDALKVKRAKGHADVEADFLVQCLNPPAGSVIVFHIQKFFPRFKKIQVDVLVDEIQKSMTVKKNGDRLGLK